MPMAMVNWRVRMVNTEGGGDAVLGCLDLKVEKADMNSSMGLGEIRNEEIR